ncbi:MAG TPA: 4Fe-4S binding protein [Candidatus Kryptonia bacterium]
MTKSGWKLVKSFRVGVSLCFATLITLLLLDVWHVLPAGLYRYVTSLQLLPSLLQIILSASGISVAGLVIVVLMTLLFGRIYCSTICPLGVLQDLLIRLSRKINKRKRFVYFRPQYWLHYLVLSLFAAMALVGGAMLIGDLVEPFSNFGRLVSVFLVPTALTLNNLTASLLGKFGVYAVSDIPIHAAQQGVIFFSLLFFVALGFLSLTEGRMFCNTFCPAGAILSLVSRISVFKLKIDKDKCNLCGACDKVCKAECVDSASGKIDFSACVGCFNCLRSCPKEGGITYELRWSQNEATSSSGINGGRRRLIQNLTIPAMAMLVAPGVAMSGKNFIKRRNPITPPGSVGVSHFTNTCTACQLCVSSCPTSVLQPSFLDYSISGMFQPTMDYSVNFCNYDCKICGDVCPTGAIKRQTVDEKKLVQIGKSKFKKEDCVVVSKKKDCAACSEHCPTKAVHTVPYESGLLLPEVDESLCIGCGACEYACPVIPNKAIKVESNPVHQIAKRPVKKQAPSPVSSPPGDFPF